MSEELKNKLISRIRENGPLSFAEFMEAALYDPEYGYYNREMATVGFDGDFITSPALSPVFGRTIARLAVKIDELLGKPDTFTLLEPGAGGGHTAERVIGAIERNEPELWKRLVYVALETGAARKRELTLKSKKESPLRVAENLDDMEELEGLIFSNEFFDALPVNRLVRRGDGLNEILVGEKEGEFVDVERPLLEGGGEWRSWFGDSALNLLDGQFTDVSQLWTTWMERLAQKLKRGAVVSIDYGYPAHELYSPARSTGTLTAYRAHKVVKNVYTDPGEQDLTAHVDFTALAIAGERVGLETLGLSDQLRLFLNLGVHEVFKEIELECETMAEFQGVMQSAKALIMPSAMGETFKALIQHKGLSGGAARELREMFPPKYRLWPASTG